MSNYEKPTSDSVKPAGELTYVVISGIGRVDVVGLAAAQTFGKVIGYVNSKGGVTAI